MGCGGVLCQVPKERLSSAVAWWRLPKKYGLQYTFYTFLPSKNQIDQIFYITCKALC